MNDAAYRKELEAQVLIIDDNEDAAASLAMLLDLEDISATTAATAEAALQALQCCASAPAILLIDIGLPGMNGYELARRLRELPQLREAALIALSGLELPPNAEQLTTAFDQFWAKPFDPRKLLAEIKAAINRVHAARARA